MTAASADPAAVRAVLVKAREWLSSPERWCHGRSAEDAQRRRVAPDNPHAVRWSLFGAVRVGCRADFSAGAAACRALLDAIPDGKGCGWDYLDDWNSMPGRTHAEVLALLDAAIAAAGED